MTLNTDTDSDKNWGILLTLQRDYSENFRSLSLSFLLLRPFYVLVRRLRPQTWQRLLGKAAKPQEN